MSESFPMAEYIESEEFQLTALQSIKNTFDAGLPAITELTEYPGKLVQVWESGKVEEISYDDNNKLNVIEVLETDYQAINEDLKKLG